MGPSLVERAPGNSGTACHVREGKAALKLSRPRVTPRRRTGEEAFLNGLPSHAELVPPEVLLGIEASRIRERSQGIESARRFLKIRPNRKYEIAKSNMIFEHPP